MTATTGPGTRKRVQFGSPQEGIGGSDAVYGESWQQSPVQEQDRIAPILVGVKANDSSGYSGCVTSRASISMMEEGIYSGALPYWNRFNAASTLAVRPKVAHFQSDPGT